MGERCKFTARDVSRHDAGGKITGVVVRRLGSLIFRRLLGMVGLGSPDVRRDLRPTHIAAGRESFGPSMTNAANPSTNVISTLVPNIGGPLTGVCRHRCSVPRRSC